METYHKIQTLFKRDMDGSLTGKKGKMMRGQWTTPDLAYLADNEWEFTEKVDGTNIRIGFNLEDSVVLGNKPIPEFGGRKETAVIPKALLSYLEETFTTELFCDNNLHAWTRRVCRPSAPGGPGADNHLGSNHQRRGPT